MKQKTETSDFGIISFPSADGRKTVNPDDIAYIKADGHAIDVHFLNDTRRTFCVCLKYAQERLNPICFFRCGDSYIVNMNFKKRYRRKKRNIIVKLKNNEEIPVSKRKVLDFLAFLKPFANFKRRMKRKRVPLMNIIIVLSIECCNFVLDLFEIFLFC